MFWLRLLYWVLVIAGYVLLASVDWRIAVGVMLYDLGSYTHHIVTGHP